MIKSEYDILQLQIHTICRIMKIEPELFLEEMKKEAINHSYLRLTNKALEEKTQELFKNVEEKIDKRSNDEKNHNS